MGIINILPPETARLIAAGEVIDRPAAALRELLDNAIDAGASEVAVRIEAGGIELIGVTDDGAGMDREDLELCLLPHATSKIRSADDLLTARTLGFRGEALASIAAAARLEILTRTQAAATAYRLTSVPGAPPRVDAAAGRPGCAVSVSGLFEAFPARRQFLKRPQAEAALCRQVFSDKAAAHPDLIFRYSAGQARTEALLRGSLSERCSALHPDLPSQLLHSLRFSGPSFFGSIVIAGPAFSRPDRRFMQTFVNRRRVQDWSLLQALDYAFAEHLPGGAHPAAFLFLEIDPALADFNIHPAKREVRLKDGEAPRRAIIAAIRDFLEALGRRDPTQLRPPVELELGALPAASVWGAAGSGSSETASSWQRASTGDRPLSDRRGWDDFMAARERPAQPPEPAAAPTRFRYLGSALGPFLVFEMDDALWFLDQHAAHERLLFDELAARPIEVQTLLLPESFEPQDEAEDARLAALQAPLRAAGFTLERDGLQWSLLTAPAALAEDAGAALREVAAEAAEPEDALRAVWAVSACRAAVKDGDSLERAAAEELIARALALPEPRCPHGRPIWARITRAQLDALVRRVV